MKFSTKDLRLASFLWSQDTVRLLGQTMVGENRKGYPEFAFDFEISITSEALDSLLAAYHNGETLVEPLRYLNRMDRLRDRLREEGTK